jgi:tetratricopeptide (TPR) repeat protein
VSAAEYSVKDVAQLFDLQEARLRYWHQTGFIGPSVRRAGRFFYTFQDLISIKVAKELLEQGLSLQAVRRSLEALRQSLPGVDRPLTQLRITADGDRVIVSGEDAPFEAHSGQVLMSFLVSSILPGDRGAPVRPLPGAEAASPASGPAPGGPASASEGLSAPAATPTTRSAALPPPLPATGYAAFLAGAKALDRGDLAAAEAAYRLAVELDPALAAAWTNLAGLLERRGARGEAREANERALILDPEQPEARYNLANLLADAGESDLAIAEYRRVLALCPEYADAFFNLGRLLDQIGAPQQARSCFLRYLELDDDSTWAERARARLADAPQR